MKLNYKHFDEINSTNNTLKDERQAREGTVLITKFQTNGRGTGTNLWESNKGENITGSILLEPVFLEPAYSFLISMAISVGITSFLLQYIDEVKIKWPNDIYIRDKKLGGILIENAFTANTITRTIAGIGLNINQTQFDKAPNPTSLKRVTGKTFNPQTLGEEMFSSIYTHYLQLKEDHELIYYNYHKFLYGKNTTLRFEDVHGIFSGEIQQVDYDGRICIKDQDGDKRYYYFKEVTLLH